ncbi:hypothetical protein [Haloarchaeobius sp. DFWS5]|uniref:hypothetical protein n=1 Tax=Haloarchaeobius sp. DFWS5 TaxID=3446114 RepID=UPI003EBE716D
MPEDETPDGPERAESDSPGSSGDGPAAGAPGGGPGDEPGAGTTDEPTGRDEELDRLYERVAELEDEVRGSRATKQSVADLRGELDDFEDDVESRTVDRDAVEGDLKRYVRKKLRRGHARGWGPYLVLLYGTVMTLGLLYAPKMEGDAWVVFAMLIVWLSTLGLYVLFLLVGVTFNVLGIPGRARDAVQQWRS